VDFNTESGSEERRGPEGSARGPDDGPPRRVRASSGEFDYTDPVQSFTNTVRRVVLETVDFFRGIARQGDFLNPLIFALICYEVSVVLGGLLGLAGVRGEQGLGAFFGSVLLAPIFAAIGLFIGAGILHLLVMLIVGSNNAGFEGTFRVISYSSVTLLVSWIPFIGWIASLYGIYLAIVGVREVHDTTTGRAALAVLIPAIVVFLLVLILITLVGAALFFSTRP
jgi:hypothetical protein